MNKTFKVIFSKARNALMVVNEATGSVQAKGTKTVVATAVTAALMVGGAAVAATTQGNGAAAVSFDGEQLIKVEDTEATIDVDLKDGVITVNELSGWTTPESKAGQGALNNISFGIADEVADKAMIVQGSEKGGVISGNTSNNRGGAMTIYQNQATEQLKHQISGITFEKNTAAADGGAIAFGKWGLEGNTQAAAELANNTFKGNSANKGGAIYLENANVTISNNSSFDGNSATEFGGSIYVDQTSSVTVDTATFTGNKVTSSDRGNGGAIFSLNGNVHVKNSTFETNTSARNGGAVAIASDNVHDDSAQQLLIANSQFTSNSSAKKGGSIYWYDYETNNREGDLAIEQTNFEKNTANTGGAIHAENAFTVTGGIFTENSAAEGGAIYSNKEASFNITGATFSQNTAKVYGGAINSIAVGNNKVTGSIFSENSASRGGAINFWSDGDTTGDQSFTVEKSQFASNSAETKGGAIAWLISDNEKNQVLSVIDSTFSENSSTGSGGAIQAEDNVVLKGQSQFTGNTAETFGGAIFVKNPKEGGLNIENGTVTSYTYFGNNEAKNQGGAIFNSADSVIGDYTVFEGNTASSGGAISNNSLDLSNPASLVIGDNVVFSGNEATTGQGGAIHNQRAELIIGDNAQFLNNKTNGFSGGAIYADTDSLDTSVTIGNNATFSGNTSASAGGAIYTFARSESVGGTAKNIKLTIGDNAQFMDNKAKTSGGAIASFAGSTIIGKNAKFTNNQSGTQGGAINNVNFGDITSILTIQDGAVFTGNKAKEKGGAIYNDGNMSIGDATFSDNWAGDKLNDIHNDGSLEVNGDLSLDGGITGEGTTHFLAESSLNVKVGMNQGQSTTITNTVVVDDGAELSFTFAPGYVGKYQPFTGDVQGEFDVDLNNSVFDITVNKDGEFVVAQKSAEGIAQATGANINQAAAVRAIMGDFSGTNETFDAIAESVALGIQSANASDRQAALDAVTALSTEAAPVIAQTQTDTATQVYAAVGSRFELTNTQEPGSNLWVQGLFSTGDYDDNGTAKGYDTDSKGIAFGLDSAVTDSVKVGVGFAYTDTDIDGFLRDTDVESKTAFIYGQYKPSNWYVNGIMSYGWASYDESKHVAGFNVGADYDVETFGLQAMTGYDFELAGVNITPEAGLRYFRISQDGYTDGAGSTVGSEDNDVLTAVIGAKVDKAWEVSPSVVIKPQARLAMTYDLVDADNNAVITLANGATYNVNGETMDRFGVEVDVGVAAEVTDNFEFALTYSGNFRGDFQNHAGLINAKYKF